MSSDSRSKTDRKDALDRENVTQTAVEESIEALMLTYPRFTTRSGICSELVERDPTEQMNEHRLSSIQRLSMCHCDLTRPLKHGSRAKSYCNRTTLEHDAGHLVSDAFFWEPVCVARCAMSRALLGWKVVPEPSIE